MNIVPYLFCFLCILSANLYAETEAEPSEESDYSYNTMAVNNDGTDNNDGTQKPEESKETVGLDKVLEDPKIAAQYKICKEKMKTDTNTDLTKCMTAAFSEEELNAISDKFFSEKLKDRYESISLGTMQNRQDPAVKKLTKYLSKRLSDALYGEIKDQENKTVTKIVDHRTFYDLYRAQVSKNIISTLTSYCIDSGSDLLIHRDETQREAVRKKNLKSLGTGFRTRKDPSKSGDDKQTAQLKTDQNLQAPDAYDHWIECIQKVQDVCHNTGEFTTFNPAGTNDIDLNYKYSQQRACIVTNHIKGLRQNLISTDQIDAQLKINAKQKAMALYSGCLKVGESDKCVAIYGRGDNKDEKTIDDLTSVSSNEFINTSGYKKSVDEQLKELETCKTNKDAQICQKYLNTKEDREKLEQASDEFAMRTLLMKKRLEKIKDNDKETLTKILLDEGRQAEEVEAILSNPNTTLKEVRDRIISNYDNERQALIKMLNSQIENRSIKKDKFDSTKGSNDLSTLDGVKQDLTSRVRQYKELIHFNNIVSGYLLLKNPDSNQSLGANLKSIHREFKDSAYTHSEEESDQRDPAATPNDTYYGTSEDIDKLTSKTHEAIGVDGTNDAQDNKTKSTPLPLDSLNKNILKPVEP